MAYPNDGEPKRWQILDRLRTMMLSIQEPDSFWSVKQATIFDSDWAILEDGPKPHIAIIPHADRLQERGSTTCGEARAFDVDLVGAIKVLARDTDWSKKAHRLLADMQVALAKSPQLNLPTEQPLVSCAAQAEGQVHDRSDKELAFVTIRVRIDYRQNRLNPSL